MDLMVFRVKMIGLWMLMGEFVLHVVWMALFASHGSHIGGDMPLVKCQIL